jgi:hypothetical protein
MMPFPPGHPASAHWYNPKNQNHAEPAPDFPPVFPWLDTTRRYMAGLTRSVAEARLAQQTGMSATNLYLYAENNPVNMIDPDGRDPQRQGGKPPQPQIGIGGSGNTCPGAAAVRIVRGLLSQKTGCTLQFEVTCNGHSLDDILKQIQFEIGKPDCGSGNPACTRFKLHHDPFDKPGPCDPRSICISESECQKGDNQIANDLIYEIGNWCGCKYKHARDEQPAIDLCTACGFTKRQCSAATFHGTKKNK